MSDADSPSPYGDELFGPDSTTGARDAAIFETFLVPRYFSHFGELALGMLVPSSDAQVVHVPCRTGYPDREIFERLPGAHLYGADPSPAAVGLARAKAATLPGAVVEYRVARHPPLDFPPSAFSHALSIHPGESFASRPLLVAELARLLGPHGQALVATPMRGSFQELLDLLREYAVKYDDAELGPKLDAPGITGPTVEGLTEEFTEAGFDFVDVDVRPIELKFRSGREFIEDPVARLIVLPSFWRPLGLVEFERPLGYVREAIDKYWSGSEFTL